MKLQYLVPECMLTLREGIHELRIAEGADSDAAETLSPGLLGDIENHDIIHVLFACPTDLAGEISAHLWTIFGTTYTVRDMHRVNKHQDHRSVLTEIGHFKLISTWIRNIPQLVSVVYRANRMNRKWPAYEYEQYLDVPLVTLRNQFNVRIPTPRKNSNHTDRGAGLRHINQRKLTTQKLG